MRGADGGWPMADGLKDGDGRWMMGDGKNRAPHPAHRVPSFVHCPLTTHHFPCREAHA